MDSNIRNGDAFSSRQVLCHLNKIKIFPREICFIDLNIFAFRCIFKNFSRHFLKMLANPIATSSLCVSMSVYVCRSDSANSRARQTTTVKFVHYILAIRKTIRNTMWIQFHFDYAHVLCTVTYIRYQDIHKFERLDMSRNDILSADLFKVIAFMRQKIPKTALSSA